MGKAQNDENPQHSFDSDIRLRNTTMVQKLRLHFTSWKVDLFVVLVRIGVTLLESGAKVSSKTSR